MMDNYINWIICGAMALTLVAVLYFDSRSRHTDKNIDVDSKDEDGEPK